MPEAESQPQPREAPRRNERVQFGLIHPIGDITAEAGTAKNRLEELQQSWQKLQGELSFGKAQGSRFSSKTFRTEQEQEWQAQHGSEQQALEDRLGELEGVMSAMTKGKEEPLREFYQREVARNERAEDLARTELQEAQADPEALSDFESLDAQVQPLRKGLEALKTANPQRAMVREQRLKLLEQEMNMTRIGSAAARLRESNKILDRKRKLKDFVDKEALS